MFQATLAVIPILWLILSLAVFRIRGDLACFIGLIITLLTSIFGFQFSVEDSLTAALEGAVMGFWPIIYIIVAAVFTYNLTTASGGMTVIKRLLMTITEDKRVLVLILAWGFGGFLEAIAGFGTAVAIPASILVALGMKPLRAALICLIANTTPTAFGAIGLPVTTLAQVTGLEVRQLSVIVSLQLFILIVAIPFVLVALTGEGKAPIKGVFSLTLASGLAFALPQVLVSHYLGAELPSIIGSLFCILVTILMVKYRERGSQAKVVDEPVALKEGFKASLPFILVFVFIMLTSSLFPAINNVLAKVSTTLSIYTGEHAKPYTIKWLTSPGTMIILATFLAGLLQGMSFGEILRILGNSIKQLTKTMLTVASIVALSKVMSYSGMINTIAISLVAVTGGFYPFIAPVIGTLGTFITGSDTSANVLFGELQVKAANNLNMNPYWMAAANMTGATAGKMISPQSIAVAAVAIGLEGQEGKLLKEVIKYCALYIILTCFVVFAIGKMLGYL
ncbi:L-lactate permease [Streptococcus porcinus]|uniref:L-lactate permease n=2 Tax=Streptococcus porcinus TaxID=1340 RepID=A0A4V0HBV4_STRPO|nr:lactate permease LctP family transporter [Streptococcus porcinus]EGJ28013.1 transporter, lactate permease family [Streptococcus porcinus str. Jelinkova 176]SQG44849.1 transporter, lactate permease family [Streptococcus porcinus]VTT45287.1 transporter, lactate permease family [Streptococcus porcinus]VTT46787.1 transporter, lactate permease family [Streptococcus porcinus]